MHCPGQSLDKLTQNLLSLPFKLHPLPRVQVFPLVEVNTDPAGLLEDSWGISHLPPRLVLPETTRLSLLTTFRKGTQVEKQALYVLCTLAPFPPWVSLKDCCSFFRPGPTQLPSPSAYHPLPSPSRISFPFLSPTASF